MFDLVASAFGSAHEGLARIFLSEDIPEKAQFHLRIVDGSSPYRSSVSRLTEPVKRSSMLTG